MRNYTYLVVDPATAQAVVIDPAWQIEKIEQALERAQAELKGVLITHAHTDHIDLAKPLSHRYRCPIWMSKEESDVSGFRASNTQWVDDADWLVGRMRIQPIQTPGHTAGGVCYLIMNNLFTGDTLFAEGCGICPDIDAAHALFESLAHLKRRLVPDTRIYPGHTYVRAPGQTFSRLLRENIYLQFKNKHDFAAYRLRKNQDRARLFNFS